MASFKYHMQLSNIHCLYGQVQCDASKYSWNWVSLIAGLKYGITLHECTQLQLTCVNGTSQSRLNYLGLLSHCRGFMSKSGIAHMLLYLCMVL